MCVHDQHKLDISLLSEFLVDVNFLTNINFVIQLFLSLKFIIFINHSSFFYVGVVNDAAY